MTNTVVLFKGTAVAVGVVPIAFEPVPDQHVSQSAMAYYVPAFAMMLVRMLAIGVDMAFGEIRAPSIKQVGYQIATKLRIIYTTLDTHMLDSFEEGGRELQIGENLAAAGFHVNGAPQDQYLVAWLSNGKESIPDGQIVPTMFIGAGTLIAEAWTQAVLEPVETLLAGKYAVVGMKVITATGIVARLIIAGQQPRPGCIVLPNISAIDTGEFRQGKAGLLGTFDSRNIPQIEVWAVAGDTKEEVILDLIYLGE